MQPTQSSMLLRMAAGTSPRTTTSEMAKRPPGLRTRKASRRTRSLSPERLMTQLEMITSTEFLKGAIENVPLPDNSVDVIISNCVINLSGDKDRVLREAFRVLKPGGRFAISDVVVRGEVPAAIRKSMELWVGCIAGALEEYEYRDKLYAAGFESVDIEPTRVYKIEEAREFLASAGLNVEKIAPLIDGKFISAFVRAAKPARRGNVVGPSCRA